MAVFFFDSSALVKRYVRETGSDWVRALMSRRARNTLIVSRITAVEVVSAIIRHVPSLKAADLGRALGYFQRHFRSRFRLIPINRSLIAEAMVLAIRHRLRGYDAVQLAAAVNVLRKNRPTGLRAPIFVSADANLNAAAAAEGLAVDDPNLHP